RDLDRPIRDVRDPQFLVLFDKIGEARLIDDVRDRLADPAPEAEERAMAGIFAFLGPRDTHAIHRGNRTVDEANDLTDLQPVSRPRQDIAPLSASAAIN